MQHRETGIGFLERNAAGLNGERPKTGRWKAAVLISVFKNAVLRSMPLQRAAPGVGCSCTHGQFGMDLSGEKLPGDAGWESRSSTRSFGKGWGDAGLHRP